MTGVRLGGAPQVRRQLAEAGLAGEARPRRAVQSATREQLCAAGEALAVRAAASHVADLLSDIAGPGAPLRELWADAAITDVLVNGPREVWVDRGAGLARVSLDVGDVRALAVRLAAAAGARLDDAAPVVDGRLPGGTRLHAVLAPVAAGGACVSLRRHAARALTLEDWCAGGGLGPRGSAVLAALVTRRANVLISGATGSGKTTLLAALLGRVGANERIVCIEEARELAPDHPHVVHLQARAPNVQGAGGVGLSDLVRAAVRMRPDRLVLGECRGREVRDVLLALNTGHDGGFTTLHANAAGDVPARLAALGSLAGMSPEAVAVQAASALDAIVHVVREGPVRRVAEIGVPALEGARLTARLALRSAPDAERAGGFDLEPAPAWPVLARQLDLGRQGRGGAP